MYFISRFPALNNQESQSNIQISKTTLFTPRKSDKQTSQICSVGTFEPLVISSYSTNNKQYLSKNTREPNLNNNNNKGETSPIGKLHQMNITFNKQRNTSEDVMRTTTAAHVNETCNNASYEECTRPNHGGTNAVNYLTTNRKHSSVTSLLYVRQGKSRYNHAGKFASLCQLKYRNT